MPAAVLELRQRGLACGEEPLALGEPPPLRLECGVLACTVLGGRARQRRLGPVQLRFARREVELAAVELCGAGGDAVGLALDRMACKLLAGEHLGFAGGEHDLARLDLREPSEALVLHGERTLRPLLLRAQLVLACDERELALLDLRQPPQGGRELCLAVGRAPSRTRGQLRSDAQ